MFINLNEATSTQAKKLQGSLKALITDTNCVITNKGIDSKEYQNYIRIFISTNEMMPIKIKKDNRRFLLTN